MIVNTIAPILRKLSPLNKSRQKFIQHLLVLFLTIPNRINFLQLERFSRQYSDRTFRTHFEQYFDFAIFNIEAIKAYSSQYCILAFDPTWIAKAGTKTVGKGLFWSGAHKKALPGIEIGCLSAIDVQHKVALHIDALQTPAKIQREQEEFSLLQHYADAILWNIKHLQTISLHLAVDAYFAKKTFIDPILEASALQVISLLRADANLKYLCLAKPTGKRGRPKQYDGKIDVKSPNLSRFKLSYQDDELTIYDLVVYHVSLKRKIRLAYTVYAKKGSKPKLYFSTDLALPAWYIVKYYRLRFQQEFLIRDGKQHLGLTDFQCRSMNKIEFHCNASLTALNHAKFSIGVEKLENSPFSLSDFKLIQHNTYMVDAIFDKLPENLNFYKNHPEIQSLKRMGIIHE